MSNTTRKRMFAWLLAIAMVFTSVNLPSGVWNAKAATATSGNCGKNGDDVTWSYDTSTNTLTISGKGEMVDYASYNGSPWYSNRSSITEIVVEKGVTSIGEYAFYSMSNVTSVQLPKTLTKINATAFKGLSKLTQIDIPKNMESIGTEAFAGCDKLTGVELPASLKTLGYKAFDITSSNWKTKVPNLKKAISHLTRGIGTDVIDCLGTSSPSTVPKVTIQGYVNKESYDLRKAQMVETKVTGYTGNGTLLYSYSSEYEEALAQELPDTTVSAPDSTEKAYGKMAWSTSYAVSYKNSYIKVTVYAIEGEKIYKLKNEVESDYLNDSSLQSDLEGLTAVMFQGESLSLAKLLGRSGIEHVESCIVAKNLSVTDNTDVSADSTGIINVGKNASGKATIHYGTEMQSTKTCTYYAKQTASNCTMQLTILPVPKVTSAVRSVTVTNAEKNVSYYINGEKGVEDAEGHVVFENLAPGTTYNMQMVVDGAGQATYPVTTLSLPDSEITIKGSAPELVYGTEGSAEYTFTTDGFETEPSFTAEDIVWDGDKPEGVTAEVTDGKVTITTAKNTPAGSYSFALRADSSGNEIVSDYMTFEVKKADLSIDSKAVNATLRAKSGSTCEVILPELPEGASYGSAEANYGISTQKYENPDRVVLTNRTDIKKGDTTGYYFVIKVNGGNNYNDKTLLIPIKFKFKTELKITGLDSADATYDSLSHKGYTGTPELAKENEGDEGDITEDLADTLEYHYTGVTNAGVKYDSTEQPTEAGTYKLTVSVPEDNENFEGSVAIDYEIKRAKATVTVKNAEKHIGKADPTFTYKVTGVVEGEELNDVTVTRAAGETAGEYDATATAKEGSNPNYDITFTAGKFTITDHIKSEKPVVENKVEATCTADGSYDEVYYCAVDGCKAEVKREHRIISATGHVFGKPVFTWNEEYSTAKATFTCVNDEKHVEKVEAKVTSETTDATCETAGKTVYKATVEFGAKTYTDTRETEIPALGHDWSGEWVTVIEPTEKKEGIQKKICKRDGCEKKLYQVLSKIGDTDEGKIEKDAEVAADAPVEEAAIDNKKSELMEAGGIFTAEEKTAIEGGSEARVWLEVSAATNLTEADKQKIEDEAKTIMGSDISKVVYFDADLFKSVTMGGKNTKTQITEPGADIKISVSLPKSLIQADSTIARAYKVIRLHNGEVDSIHADLDKETGILSFKTDRFSTYAIVFTDAQLVTGVTIPSSGNNTLTKAGETLQLTATVLPNNAADKKVTWTSSNRRVATVDANGLVTAVGNGTTTITVTTADGAKTATITITVNIPASVTKPAKKPSNASTTAITVSKKAQEKNGLALNSKLKVSQSGKQINISWGKVKGAAGYNVYVQYCGQKINAKSLNQVKSGSKVKIVVKKVNGKKLNLKKNYKIYVEAYKFVNGKKVILGKTITAHIVGRKNLKQTNVKQVKVKMSSYNLSVGKKAKIKASTVLVDKTKKPLSNAHAKELRYDSDNKKVANVSKTGQIKAVAKGTCTIYVYARNGYAKKVRVTVK